MIKHAEEFVKLSSDRRRLLCYGHWNIANLPQIKLQLKEIASLVPKEIIVEGTHIKELDSAGAWLLCVGFFKNLKKGTTLQWESFSEQQSRLMEMISKKTQGVKEISKRKKLEWIERVGKSSLVHMKGVIAYLSFVGELTITALRLTIHPRHWRFNAIVNVIDSAGVNALLIIGLLSCMIGVVLAYQIGLQLRDYGANVFVVDLIGISVLREFGPLITAIMLAGRTGSSFTAQLGTMKVNQEIDALNTMGVTPGELLLLPRIVGLVVVMPLLTMWADFFGVFGGMVMSKTMLDIGWQDFLIRFQHQVPLKSLVIGICKAPVFALIIASIGCFEGMEVKGSADSVGRQTTSSVVWSIFYIIVIDALFSVIFSRWHL